MKTGDKKEHENRIERETDGEKGGGSFSAAIVKEIFHNFRRFCGCSAVLSVAAFLYHSITPPKCAVVCGG